MIFNRHTNYLGTHAFLSASNPAWLNYDEDKLARVFTTSRAAQYGTELHEFAAHAIRLGIKQRKIKTTFNMYVNDCIGWRMTPEQVLYYSRNCYGTTDAISFRANKLRVSDLKTGMKLSSEKQLEVYAALFCLEYMVSPFDIEIELRIYQNDEIRFIVADPDRIAHIMNDIKYKDRLVEEMRWEDDA